MVLQRDIYLKHTTTDFNDEDIRLQLWMPAFFHDCRHSKICFTLQETGSKYNEKNCACGSRMSEQHCSGHWCDTTATVSAFTHKTASQQHWRRSVRLTPRDCVAELFDTGDLSWLWFYLRSQKNWRVEFLFSGLVTLQKLETDPRMWWIWGQRVWFGF